MSELALVLVALVVGAAVVAAIRPSDAGEGAESALRRLTALALGLALVATWTAASLLRPVLAPGGSRATDVACVLAVGVSVIVAWRSLRRRARSVVGDDHVGPRNPKALVAILCAALACALALVVARFLHRPDGEWDAISFWNLRARLLHRAGGDATVVFGSAVSGDHADYPLFVPGLVAAGWALVGEGATWVTGVVALLFGGLAAAGVHTSVAARRGGVAAAIALLALVAYRAFLNSTSSRYVDVPLSALLVLACGFVAAAYERPARARSAIALAGLSASLAAWTKNEGAVHAIAVGLVFLARPPAGVRRVGVLASYLAGAAPFLAILLAFKLGLAPTNDLVAGSSSASAWARLTDSSRYATIARHLFDELSRTTFGSFLLPATIALVVFGPRRRAGDAPVAAVLGLVALAYAAVYVLTPQPLDWHLTWSLDRLLLHLYPSLLLAAALRVAPPRVVAAPSEPGAAPSPAPSRSAP